MFELQTQPLSIVLEIANVRAIIRVKQHNNDTNQEISKNESEDHGEFTLSSDNEEDDLDTQQEVLHLHQACRGKKIRITRVPLPENQSRADTVIARTSLSNLQHPAWTIVPPFLKYPMSTINILCNSDVVPAQALPLPIADRNQNVPPPKAGGDYHVPQYPKASFDVGKWFMTAIVFKKSHWRIISD